ncbi:Anthranilate synthase component 1 [compost metagenome]
MQASLQASGPDLPPFAGGAVGYWGFETVRHLEPSVGDAPPDDLGLPEAAFLLTRSLIAFDHAKRTMRVMTIVQPNGDPARAYQDATGSTPGSSACARPSSPSPSSSPSVPSPWSSTRP